MTRAMVLRFLVWFVIIAAMMFASTGNGLAGYNDYAARVPTGWCLTFGERLTTRRRDLRYYARCGCVRLAACSRCSNRR
jgi:hypothetical protein